VVPHRLPGRVRGADESRDEAGTEPQNSLPRIAGSVLRRRNVQADGMRRRCSCTPAERGSRVAPARFRNPACRGRSSRGIRLQRTGNSEVDCGNQRRSVAQLRRQRRGRTAPTARRTRRLPKLAVPTIPGPRDGLRKLGVARPLAIDIRLARGLHARHRRLATSVPPRLVPRAPSANLLSDSIPGSHPSNRPWRGRTRRFGFVLAAAVGRVSFTARNVEQSLARCYARNSLPRRGHHRRWTWPILLKPA